MLTGSTPAARTAGSLPTPRERRPFLVAWAARLVATVLAGLGLYATFPPIGQWWLGPLALALLLVVVAGRRPWPAAGYGAVFAVAFQYPLMDWTGAYVGPVWLLLLLAMTGFVVVAVAGMAAVGRLPGCPLWQACVWVAVEAWLERWPFGGFPWAKVAFGQPGGVLAPLAALGGAPLVSFAVVLTGASLASLFRTGRVWLRHSAPPDGAAPVARPRAALALAVVGVLAAPVAGLATLPALHAAPPPGQQRTITVAAVQGNVPQPGLDFNAVRRAVLDDHVAETRRLAADVRAGTRPRPDLVIWPENASDIDPFLNADARAEIQSVTDEVGVPVVVGAVQSGVRDADGTILRGPRVSVVLWTPRGGPGAVYVKRHLAPFGEYVPLRSIAREVSPDNVDRVTDFEPGTGSGVLDTGPARLGVAICYEVVFDSAVRDTVAGGADLLTVPTNNAPFGFTDMTYQQQGMSRIRAIEHDRSVVIAATSGQSAIVAPDGSVVARTGALFTPGILDQPVELRTTTTWATRLGPAPELGLAAVGVVAVLVAVAGGIRDRRRERRRRGTGAGGGRDEGRG